MPLFENFEAGKRTMPRDDGPTMGVDDEGVGWAVMPSPSTGK